jgi:hypothetical protein
MISDLIGEEVYKGSVLDNIGIKDAIINTLKIIVNKSNDNFNLKGKVVA